MTEDTGIKFMKVLAEIVVRVCNRRVFITCCLILHIEDGKDMSSPIDYQNIGTIVMSRRYTNRIQAFHEVYRKIEDRSSYHQQKEDLIKHHRRLTRR